MAHGVETEIFNLPPSYTPKHPGVMSTHELTEQLTESIVFTIAEESFTTVIVLELSYLKDGSVKLFNDQNAGQWRS